MPMTKGTRPKVFGDTAQAFSPLLPRQLAMSGSGQRAAGSGQRAVQPKQVAVMQVQSHSYIWGLVQITSTGAFGLVTLKLWRRQT
jgi:hypothetical protein